MATAWSLINRASCLLRVTPFPGTAFTPSFFLHSIKPLFLPPNFRIFYFPL